MRQAVLRSTIAIVLTLAAGVAQALGCVDPDPLQVAVIPKVRGQIAEGHYEPLLAALRSELQRDVVLLPLRSYGAVQEGLHDGSVHLAGVGPGSYVLVRQRGTQVLAFAAMAREHPPQEPASYRSVLITLRQSRLHTLEQLRGASLSLVDPVSTSGALIPRSAVASMTGSRLEDWFGRVSFAGSHDNALEAVLSRKVDAAFVADLKVSSRWHQGEPVAEMVRVIWRSDPIPADPFVYQESLCEPVKQGIRRAFLENQERLRPLLERYRRVGFVEVSETDYAALLARVVSP